LIPQRLLVYSLGGTWEGHTQRHLPGFDPKPTVFPG